MTAKRIVLVQVNEHDPDTGDASFLILRKPTSVQDIIQKLHLLPTAFEFFDTRRPPLAENDDVYSAVQDKDWLFIPPWCP